MRTGSPFSCITRAILIILPISLTVGCARAPVASAPPARDTARVVSVPYQRAWDAALHTAIALEYRPVYMQPQRGLLVAERDGPPSEIRSSTDAPLGALDQRWWSLQTRLIITCRALEPSRTEVDVRSSLLARSSPVVDGRRRSADLVPLDSNGTPERRWLDAFEAFVSGGWPDVESWTAKPL